MQEKNSHYRPDLAYIHDMGFGDFARQAAPGILALLQQRGITQGLVVDLGCGSGIWAQRLLEAGYEILGIDISVAMIALARQRAPQGDFRQGSFLHVPLPACVAVTALGESFNYCFDPDNSWPHLVQLCQRIFEALCPGGLLIFDLAEPGRGTGPSQRHRAGEDWVILLDVEENASQRLLTRRITTFRQEGALYRRDTEVHRLQLFKGTEMAQALRHLGFLLRLLRSYGAFRFPKGLVGMVARKP